MTQLSKASILATGFSMFSMFFGAGNVVFPLVLGQTSAQYVSYASIGLIFTGVVLPLLGLLSMMLFRGDYRAYFLRLGKWPGLFVIFLIMALLGPFAGIPRTVTLSQSTMVLSGIDIPAWLFNGIFCALFLVLAYQRSRIVDILGYLLTPILLVLLGVIVIAGLIQPTEMPTAGFESTPLAMILRGASEGYNTLDLLAALFFSTVIIAALQSRFKDSDDAIRQKHILYHAGYASLIGGILLGLVYVGFCLLAAKYSTVLQNLDSDQLIAYLSFEILGNKAGWIVNGVVSLACLTTAIALASVFAEVMCEELTGKKRYYHAFLFGTAVVAYGMSFIGFTGIITLIYPLLVICYPAIIVLAFLNMANKLWGWTIIKTPVFLTAGAALAAYIWTISAA
ncbi:MAG: branched-chain amino acid transport system II carrier protein [Gammaproteobacteria bacterium]